MCGGSGQPGEPGAGRGGGAGALPGPGDPGRGAGELRDRAGHGRLQQQRGVPVRKRHLTLISFFCNKFFDGSFPNQDDTVNLYFFWCSVKGVFLDPIWCLHCK